MEPSTKLKQFTKESIAEKYSQIVDLELEELKRIRDYPRSNAIKAVLAACIIKGKETGDYSQLDKIFDRIIGKVPIKTDLDVKGDMKLSIAMAAGLKRIADIG